MPSEHKPEKAIAVVGPSEPAAILLPAGTSYRGNLDLLAESLTALFCSNRCPGDIILGIYDLARGLRDSAVPVIGGFQTPMEKECLRMLLRGRQPIVLCPARSIQNMRVPREWHPGLKDGRLLILSRFASTHKRPTVKLAAERNDLVAKLARQVFIAHASNNGKTEAFADNLASSGKPLLTLSNPANSNLISMGAKTIRVIRHRTTSKVRLLIPKYKLGKED